MTKKTKTVKITVEEDFETASDSTTQMNPGSKSYILIDRSGSMGDMWSETLKGINGYVKELTDDTEVLVATFDHFDGRLQYNIIRDTKARLWDNITVYELSPRGGTPLLQAACKMFDRVFKDNKRKTTVVIMTDGYENASDEYFTKEMVAEMVKRAKNKDWGVVFLGADFSGVHKQSSQLGVNFNQTLNITPVNIVDTWKNLGTKSRFYSSDNSTALAAYTFNDSDRKASGENLR